MKTAHWAPHPEVLIVSLLYVAHVGSTCASEDAESGQPSPKQLRRARDLGHKESWHEY